MSPGPGESVAGGGLPGKPAAANASRMRQRGQSPTVPKTRSAELNDLIFELEPQAEATVQVHCQPEPGRA